MIYVVYVCFEIKIKTKKKYINTHIHSYNLIVLIFMSQFFFFLLFDLHKKTATDQRNFLQIT